MDSKEYVLQGASGLKFCMSYLAHSEKDKLLRKMRNFCDYQPRSHFDIRKRLTELGVWKRDREEILAQLIEEGYLNEQRFVNEYVTSNIEAQKWGRNKLKYKLKSKFNSDRCINDALKTIDDEKYKATLLLLATEKWNSVKGIGANQFVKMRKTGSYLQQKGYETNLIWEVLNKLKNEKKSIN